MLQMLCKCFVITGYVADEVAGHSPADQLPIEKTREAPVCCLLALIWLSGGVQTICDAKKVSARHF